MRGVLSAPLALGIWSGPPDRNWFREPVQHACLPKSGFVEEAGPTPLLLLLRSPLQSSRLVVDLLYPRAQRLFILT